MPLDPDGINYITCPKCAGTAGFVESCDRCRHTGYVYSFVNGFGDIISVCPECNGKGCDTCHSTGRTVKWHEVPDYSPINIADLMPMPYGKMLPDLTDCEYPNEEEDNYFEPMLCPGCSSTNIVILDHIHNPELIEEQVGLGDRWFCISCQDSWCYEREK